MKDLSLFWLLAVLAVGGCASKPAVRKDPPVEQRIPDSASERLDSLPGVDNETQPENADRRFGIKAARELRERQRRARQKVQPKDGTESVDVVGEDQELTPEAPPAPAPGNAPPAAGTNSQPNHN